MREAEAGGKPTVIESRDKALSLSFLESLGLNVPLYTVVTSDDFESAKNYKRQCAIRFDELGCDLPPIKGIVIGGFPPLIAHTSPCVAYELFKELKERGCRFRAHVTDVTIADTVGAGVTMKDPRLGVIAELSVGGSVRDITRRGKVDTYVKLEGCKMKAKGPLTPLLSYCAFKSLKVMEKMPYGLLEWSCHKGRYGTKGDHVLFWEFIPFK